MGLYWGSPFFGETTISLGHTMSCMLCRTCLPAWTSDAKERAKTKPKKRERIKRGLQNQAVSRSGCRCAPGSSSAEDIWNTGIYLLSLDPGLASRGKGKKKKDKTSYSYDEAYLPQRCTLFKRIDAPTFRCKMVSSDLVRCELSPEPV